MRVAIDAFRLIDEPYTSGATYVAELTTTLAALPDIELVKLILPRAPDSTFRYRHLVALAGVTVAWPETATHPSSSYRSTLSWIQRTIPKLLRGTDVDWYVAPYHQAPVGLRRTTKVITVIHDVCGLFPSSGYYWHKKGPYRHLTNFVTALWRSDALVYVSEHTASRFRRLFPWARSKASRVILNRVAEPGLSPGTVRPELSALGLEPGSYFLAFAARGRRKGLDLVLSGFRAYLRSGDVGRLVLVTGPDFAGSLMELLRSYNISRYVTVVSSVTDSQRDALYVGALALAFPSRCEGFGYPVLEAMACGCPPIAWQGSPAKEIVGAAAPLLERLDPDQIALHLRRVAGMSTEQRTQLRAALQRRAGELNATDVGREFVELMKSVA